MGEGTFAGIDWASEEHACCVVDGEGRIVEGRRFAHDERGIRALCARLLELEVARVAIERPERLHARPERRRRRNLARRPRSHVDMGSGRSRS